MLMLVLIAQVGTRHYEATVVSAADFFTDRQVCVKQAGKVCVMSQNFAMVSNTKLTKVDDSFCSEFPKCDQPGPHC